MDEGYIKYQCHWQPTTPFKGASLQALIYWRQRVYDCQCIGTYPDGLGYGNISERIGSTNTFFISGSATGGLHQIEEAHFAKVNTVSIEDNELWCEGPLKASSESMSHAVIYQALPEVGAIVHAHHLGLWKQLLHKVPTTDADAAYGTPEMAHNIIQLIVSTDLVDQRIFVMEGHREGIFTFGASLKEAFDVLHQHLLSLI